MQNQKVLEKLGYSRNEAKVYLTSLTIGEAQVSDIADKVRMPRSTVQVIVERLHADGLMNFYVMRRYKYWVAEDPSILLEKLKAYEVLVEESIPRLIALKRKARVKQKIARLQGCLGPLRELADGMSQPVLIADREAEIQYVNQAWEAHVGYTSDEVYGKHVRILKSGQSPPEEYERLWKLLKAGKLFESNALINQKKDGTLFSLFTIIFAVAHGNRTFYIQIYEERANTRFTSEGFKHLFENSADSP
jgi:PAS domain S-box-containing protein